MITDKGGSSDFDLGVRSLEQAKASLESRPLEADMPERIRYSPTYNLIRLHHMTSGACTWNREKFRRLCVAFNETEEEMGMRIGLAPAMVRARMDGVRFTVPEGILLQLHWNYIQQASTGLASEETAMAPFSR